MTEYNFSGSTALEWPEIVTKSHLCSLWTLQPRTPMHTLEATIGILVKQLKQISWVPILSKRARNHYFIFHIAIAPGYVGVRSVGIVFSQTSCLHKRSNCTFIMHVSYTERIQIVDYRRTHSDSVDLRPPLSSTPTKTVFIPITLWPFVITSFRKET